MWISRIELTNFKSYQHADFEFPEPTDGKNIALIGGMNGYGKTSILEALYLALYGKDAIIHLARAGLKTDDIKGYPTFLERAFNGEAKRDGQDSMSVRIVINKTKTRAIDIHRRWYFKSSTGGWSRDEEAVVREIIRGVPGIPKMDGKNSFQLSEMLDDQFVPAHIAPFFFFDGEEVKKLADQSRIEQVKQGLEGLLGVVLLRQLAERLRDFEASKRATVSNVDESNIAKMLDELTIVEDQLSHLRKDSIQRNDKLKQLKAERESHIERITASGGGGGDIATVKDLVQEREELRNAQREVRKRLERILADKLPFHLMPLSLLQEFKSQIDQEMALAAWQTECKALQPKRDKFQEAFLRNQEPDFDPKLRPQQLKVIKTRIESAWASLFHPPPSNCAEKITHGYLHEGLREKALIFLNSITVGQQEVHDLLSEQRNLSDQIDELGRKISRIEGIDRDGTLSNLKQELSRISQELEQIEDEIRRDDREIVGLEVTYNNTRSRYEQEKKRLEDTSPVRSLVGKSERVRTIINEVIPLLFPLKVQALATSMTKVYKRLAHKDQVSKIVIDDNGTTQILGKTGKEIIFDRSAGENQIFATALIAGLAEVSKVKSPMVVDTPLGRLDSRHRENILSFWTSNSSRQVILLSQDKEIDSNFFKRLKANISVSYLLEHSEVGDGIGRTIAIRDRYFEVAE